MQVLSQQFEFRGEQTLRDISRRDPPYVSSRGMARNTGRICISGTAGQTENYRLEMDALRRPAGLEAVASHSSSSELK